VRVFIAGNPGTISQVSNVQLFEDLYLL